MSSPPNEVDLALARERAVDAVLRAEELEAQARKARRLATSRMKNYETLVGQAQQESA